VVDSLGWDVRADIAEDKLRLWPAVAPTQRGHVEAVVAMYDAVGRHPEVVSKAFHQRARRRHEAVCQPCNPPHVVHASAHPAGPVGDILLPLIHGAGEVPGVAPLGTGAVVLSGARGPQVGRILRVHLHELATRAHQPVVVQGEDDGDVSEGCLFQKGGGEMVQVTHVHDVRLKVVEQLREPLVDPIPAVSVASIGYVHQVKEDARIVRIALASYIKLRREWVLTTCEDLHRMVFRESLRQRLRVHFGPGVKSHWVAVDDQQDAHGCFRGSVAAVSGERDAGRAFGDHTSQYERRSNSDG
jgi:hypothetical protein